MTGQLGETRLAVIMSLADCLSRALPILWTLS